MTNIAHEIIKKNKGYKSRYDAAFKRATGMTTSPQLKIFDFSDGSKLIFDDKNNRIEVQKCSSCQSANHSNLFPLN